MCCFYYPQLSRGKIQNNSEEYQPLERIQVPILTSVCIHRYSMRVSKIAYFDVTLASTPSLASGFYGVCVMVLLTQNLLSFRSCRKGLMCGLEIRERLGGAMA